MRPEHHNETVSGFLKRLKYLTEINFKNSQEVSGEHFLLPQRPSGDSGGIIVVYLRNLDPQTHISESWFRVRRLA
jgi:hypothetical protein